MNEKRRRGPDLLVRMIRYFSIAAWICIIIIFSIVSFAKPGSSYNFFSQGSFAGGWDPNLMQYAFYLMVIVLIVSVIGVIINSSRHRRQSDSYNRSLIVLGVISIIGIILYLVNFTGG